MGGADGIGKRQGSATALRASSQAAFIIDAEADVDCGFQRLAVRAELPQFAAGAQMLVLLPSYEVHAYTSIPSPYET